MYILTNLLCYLNNKIKDLVYYNHLCCYIQDKNIQTCQWFIELMESIQCFAVYHHKLWYHTNISRYYSTIQPTTKWSKFAVDVTSLDIPIFLIIGQNEWRSVIKVWIWGIFFISSYALYICNIYHLHVRWSQVLQLCLSSAYICMDIPCLWAI